MKDEESIFCMLNMSIIFNFSFLDCDQNIIVCKCFIIKEIFEIEMLSTMSIVRIHRYLDCCKKMFTAWMSQSVI